MTVNDIKTILEARLVCGEKYLDKEVHTACGSDMMSDVLAYVKDQSVLLTGLCNTQAIRTSEMMDIVCIVFVRGKEPDCTMISLAEERGPLESRARIDARSNRKPSTCISVTQ
jgi:predicted transcriptional regulator